MSDRKLMLFRLLFVTLFGIIQMEINKGKEVSVDNVWKRHAITCILLHEMRFRRLEMEK